MNLTHPLAVCAALVLAAVAGRASLSRIDSTAPAPASGGAAPLASRFETVDIMVDSGARTLGAYQIEVKASAPKGTVALIVGIEGGEKDPFMQPPFYDPAALQGGRVILAAYTLSDKAPSGRFRVARVHMLVTGPAPVNDEPRIDPEYTAAVITAAAPDAAVIPLSAITTVGGRK
ncbi:MAG: hypothetical protein ACT4PL_06965 [Phycisphaerales bacterium]